MKKKVLKRVLLFLLSKSLYIIPGLLLVVFYLEAGGDTRSIASKYNNLAADSSSLISTKEQFVAYADVVVQQQVLQQASANSKTGVTPIGVLEAAQKLYDEFVDLVFPMQDGHALTAPYYYLYFDLVAKQVADKKYTGLQLCNGKTVNYDTLYKTWIQKDTLPAISNKGFINLSPKKDIIDLSSSKWFKEWYANQRTKADNWCAMFASCVYYEAQKDAQFFPISANCMQQLGKFIADGAQVHIIPGTNGALHWDVVKRRLVADGRIIGSTLDIMSKNIFVEEYTPRVGDIMYCVDDPSKNGSWYAAHVRIVIGYDAGKKKVTTVEGNVGGPGAPLYSNVDKKEYELTGRNSIFVTPRY